MRNYKSGCWSAFISRAAAAGAFLWAACSLPGAELEASTITKKEQAAARKLYVTKCAKCHAFYEPRNYSEPAWRRWMDSMADKSKLKKEQEELLNRYLDDYRAGKLQKAR